MRHVSLVTCLIAFASQLSLPALTFEDDFSTRRDGWQAVGGKWAWEGGKLVQTAPTDSYSQFVRDEPLAEGTITVEAAATAPNSSKDGCVGIVCKHLDKDNWIAIRFGAYKGIMALMTVAGKKEIVQLRQFTCELGRRYRCEVQMTHGIILVTLDGKTTGVIADPFKGQPGRPGIFAQSPAEFYRFRVDDKARVGDVTSEANARFASGPRVTEDSKTWRLEAADYSVAPLSPTLRSAELCTLALYLRNRGT
ncbi:MAG: hypothetical protein FJ278_20580, partial [Planctomycetes bacterium]|nr:hypothetical protein [Planctomycetota bacterium]